VEVELERGGQILFVHNRVETIYEIAAKIQELVPTARIVVGHGQMGESDLEKAMLSFMHHEHDVLVATTIIENGSRYPAGKHDHSSIAPIGMDCQNYTNCADVSGRSNRRAYFLPVDPARTRVDGNCTAQACCVEGILRSRCWVQNRRTRS